MIAAMRFRRGLLKPKFTDRYVKYQKNYDPEGQVMVWGMISRNGEIRLVMID
jgi:hypothetical protein